MSGTDIHGDNMRDKHSEIRKASDAVQHMLQGRAAVGATEIHKSKL